LANPARVQADRKFNPKNNIIIISVCWSREPHQNRAVVAFYGWARTHAHTQRPHPASPAAQPMATVCKKIRPFDGKNLNF
jgi:hypothetical protein